MRAALFAALALPLAEIVVLLLVGRAVGTWWLLAWLVAAAILGVALMRGTAARTLAALRQAGGAAGLRPVLQGLTSGLAGLLLLIPGLITDVVALALLVPVVRRWLVTRLGRRRAGPEVIDGEWRRVEPQDRFPPR